MTAHPDHAGFAERARTDAGAQVWIHQADAEAARTGKPGWKNEGSTFSYLLRNAFYRTAFSLARRGAVKIIPVKEVSSFADGGGHRRAGFAAGPAHARSHSGQRRHRGGKAQCAPGR